MRRAFCIPVILTVLLSACQPASPDMPDSPVREKQIPEKVEEEALGILSKDWGALLDTARYFNNNFLKKGRLKGTGPDGVYYEMDLASHADKTVSLCLYVRDSLFVEASGSLSPISLEVGALGTVLNVSVDKCAWMHLGAGRLGVAAPPDFLFNRESCAELFYENADVGYITREPFEDESYRKGMCFVIHYHNDPRTFAFHDSIFH